MHGSNSLKDPIYFMCPVPFIINEIEPIYPVTELKEFERRFKFKPWLKYGWFHLKLYQMFQDLSRR